MAVETKTPAPSGVEIRTVAVVGAGTMGSGIAQVAAMAGYRVILNDVSQALVDRSLEAIRQSLKKLASKHKITPDQVRETRERLQPVTDLEPARGADLVIEAVTEKLELKQQVFRRLDEICPEKTVFATNTSSLSVMEMAAATRRPDRFLGLHFFNPPVLMRLVEVVRTPATSEETFRAGWEVVERMGKTPVETRDTPGFIFNRLIIPYLNEAVWALYEGAGSTADIDRAMVLGGNMPLGPLSLLDLIGLDVQLHACRAMFEQLKDPKFRPCPLNLYMVRAGYLGKKSGKGFYDYSGEKPVPVDLSPFRA